MSSSPRCAPVMFWECNSVGRGLATVQLQLDPVVGRGLQLQLRTACWWCSWKTSCAGAVAGGRRQNCSRELQGPTPCRRLLQPPDLLVEGWGGVQPGQTHCTATARQIWGTQLRSLSRLRLKVFKVFKVFQSGLEVATGSRLLLHLYEKTTFHFRRFKRATVDLINLDQLRRESYVLRRAPVGSRELPLKI